MTLDRWDSLPELERSWWLERDRRTRSTHSCGHSREVCSDPEHEWFPQLTICYAEREEQAAQAAFERLHEKRPWHDGTMKKWAKEPSSDFPYHYRHGTRVWVADTDLGMGGDFLRTSDHQEPENTGHTDTAS